MSHISRTLFFVLTLALLFCSKIFSQDSDTLHFKGFSTPKFPFKQNVIKSNLIPVFMGQIPLCGDLRFTYERMLTHNQSFTLGVSYNFPNLLLVVLPAITNPNNRTLKNFSMRGGRLTLGYRFYPLKRKHAPAGLFVGPYGSFNFVKIKERKGTGDYWLYCYANASLILGYQFHLRKGVFMEFFAGLGYRKNFEVFYDSHRKTYAQHDLGSVIKPPLVTGDPFKNVKFSLQMNIGFGW